LYYIQAVAEFFPATACTSDLIFDNRFMNALSTTDDETEAVFGHPFVLYVLLWLQTSDEVKLSDQV
jgi:hypothetical protein